MAIYLKLAGIEGDVTAKGHEKWIEAQSIQFAADVPTTMNVGRQIDRINGTPYLHEVIITKQADISSVHLFHHTVTKKTIPEVKIDICKTGKEITPSEIWV